MESSEISKIIEDEIKENRSISNAHGIDLKRCLVTPTKQTYEDSFNPDRVLELWLVLEEMPEDKSGYKIVFDEKSGLFGLATRGFYELDVFIGYYGSFLDTLKGM